MELIKEPVSNFSRKLNILQSEIIAVGNAGNDLTMIEYAD
jgi:hydroxymethylpyrimidine pyrophosphatase-like HAD family hydrolase